MSMKRQVKDINKFLEAKEKRPSDSDYKRYFCALASNTKRALGLKHLGYYVDSLLLFKEATKRQVSKSDWVKFIIKELNERPEKWIKPKKLQKIQEL